MRTADAPVAERPARRLDCFAMRSGVRATAVPFPSPLAYSFSYALRYPTGVVVVDLGRDSDEVRDAFCGGLARAGAGLGEVIGVVVTQAHPDHYGLASRIRAHTGAKIAAHPAERAQIRVDDTERRERGAPIGRWLAGCGVPGSVVAGQRDQMKRMDAVLLADAGVATRRRPGYRPRSHPRDQS